MQELCCWEPQGDACRGPGSRRALSPHFTDQNPETSGRKPLRQHHVQQSRPCHTPPCFCSCGSLRPEDGFLDCLPGSPSRAQPWLPFSRKPSLNTLSGAGLHGAPTGLGSCLFLWHLPWRADTSDFSLDPWALDSMAHPSQLVVLSPPAATNAGGGDPLS